MTRIFISYCSEDSTAAAALADDLRKVGNEIWMDKELSGAQDWWDTILAEIRRADIFVLALSPKAKDSLAP